MSFEADGEDGLFDGVAELWFDSIAAAEAGFASPEGRASVAEATAHLARREPLYVTEHKFVNTGKPSSFKLVSLLKRRKDLSRAQFKQWWLERHAPLVVVFPEGAASWSPDLGELRPGAGHLALTPGVTVVPAAIWGTQDVLRGWRPVGRGPVKVVFGEPVPVPGEGAVSARAAEVTRRLRAAIEGLLAPMTGAV